MNPLINAIVLTTDKKRFRILHYDSLNKVYFIIDMDKNRWPYAIDKEELAEGLKTGSYKYADKQEDEILIPEEQLSGTQIKKRDKAWMIVQFLFADVVETHFVFYSKYRQKSIIKTSKRFNISANTVRNYLLRYWKNGMTMNALLPNYHNCGGKGKERTSKTKKLGRPRADGSKGVNIDEAIRKKFVMGLNRHYYTDKQNSLKLAYELTIKDFFTDKEVDANGKEIRILDDPKKIPTYNQFKYWFEKVNDPKKEISTRFGTRTYFQKHRAIVGDSTQDAGLGPSTLWQTDSTPLDVHCVSAIDRNILVGKPLLHLVIDVYSRVIVGFSLSFESLNAYSGAMNALYNSMTSKRKLCEKYQIDIGDEWDISCIPQRIFTDRGELENSQIENAIEHLGISIQNSPGYRPETKAVIEQAFLQVMQRIVPHVDGAVIGGNKVKERGEQDYRLNANLTIYELTQVLIKCIVFYNNHHVMKDYNLDEGMIEAGINKIPMEIWKYGVENMRGNLRTLPDGFIRMHLLETKEGRVTARGLKFKNALYINKFSLKNRWFEKAREKTWKIKVWFDPTDLTQIYTLNEESNVFMEFKLLDHMTKYKNKNIVEIDSMIKEENTQVKEAKEKELKEKVKLFQEIETIVKSGRNKTEEELDPTISKTAKLTGIRENQIQERDFQRKWEVEGTISEKEDNDLDNQEIEDEFDLFRGIRDREG